MNEVFGLRPVAGMYRSVSMPSPFSSFNVALLEIGFPSCVTETILRFLTTVTPTCARYLSAFAAMEARRPGRI